MDKEHIKYFKPTNWAIANKTAVYVITILITLTGFNIFLNIPKEQFPDIVVPTIYVSTIYPGASPEDIENLITKPIEKQVKSVNGVKKVTSNSLQDISVMIVEFNTGVNVDFAKQKISDAVDKAKNDLPTDLDNDPIVQEVNFSEFPIMNINISGDYSLEQLKKFAEMLKDKAESFPEITRLDIIGALDREVHIDIDLYRMQALGIALGDVEGAVARENVNISGGDIRVKDLKRTLRVRGEFKNISEIGNITIRSARGNVVYLKDIANVTDSNADIQNYARLDGKPVITLNVIKRSGENLIEAADKIKETIEEFKATKFPDGLKVVLTADSSIETKVQLTDLINTVIIGFLLVLFILMFFMGLQSAFFVALAVPLSVMVAMLLMPSLDFTLNVIVLFSFLLALGIIVDDAIVVIENTHRIYHSYDFDIREASRAAAGEVFVPVLAGTLTTIAPFFPLLFWPGIVGEFMSYLPVTLILTLFASLLVAFIMNPVFAVDFMKRDHGNNEPKPFRKKIKLMIGLAIVVVISYVLGWFGIGNFTITAMVFVVLYHFLFEPGIRKFQNKLWPSVIEKYKKIAFWSVKHPWKVITSVIVLFFVSILALIIAKPPVEFFPQGDPNFAYIYIEMPIGTDASVTDSVTRIVEKKVNEVVGKDNPNVESIITNVGIGAGDPQNPDRVSTPHKGKISVAFVDFSKRNDFSTSESLQKIREELKEIPGVKIAVDKEQNGPPTGKPISIEIAGDDFDRLQGIENSVKKKIEQAGIKGIEGLRSDLVRNKPEIIVEIDDNRALELGMSKVQIGLQLRTALFGKEISKFRDIDDDAPIQLRLDEKYRSNVESLLNMDISYLDMSTGMFKQVPLSSVASVKYEDAFSSINRKNQRRVVTLSSNVEDGYNANEIVSKITALVKQIDIPDGYEIKMGGEQEQQKETSDFLGVAFLGALALMYLILVLQFNSAFKPFLIFSTVFFSLIGVFLGISIFGMKFSIVMTGVGVFALAGIVIRNGILLIEFIEELKTRGIENDTAVVEGGATRMTPVILTASAAILGLIPLAIGLNIHFDSLFAELDPQFFLGGDNVAFWGPLAWTMIFGLIVATFLTLIVLPSMYTIYSRAKNRFQKLKKA